MGLRRWWNELDESAQGAVHFVLTGALLIAAVRGLLWVGGLRALNDPILTPFQAGYYMPPTGALVWAEEDLLMRTVRAAALAVFTGTFSAMLARPFVSHWRNAFTAGRWGLLLSLVWWLTTAWFVPATTLKATVDGWERNERNRISGDLWVPWGGSHHTIAGNAMPIVQTTSRKSPNGKCMGIDVLVDHGTGLKAISRIAMREVECDTALWKKRTREALSRSIALSGQP